VVSLVKTENLYKSLTNSLRNRKLFSRIQNHFKNKPEWPETNSKEPSIYKHRKSLTKMYCLSSNNKEELTVWLSTRILYETLKCTF